MEKTFEQEQEMNSRSEYPAARLVIDIMELLQAMASIGFCTTFQWRSDCAGDPLITVDVWDSVSDGNVYGEPTKDGQNAPLVSSCGSKVENIGWCSYSETETYSLHRLYDLLFALYQTRKNAIEESVEPIPF